MSVTVTVNVPADKLLIVAVVAPLLHKYWLAVVVTLTDPLGLAQLVLFIAAHVAVGPTPFVNCTVQVLVHISSVTSTLYIPAPKLEIILVFPPFYHITL